MKISALNLTLFSGAFVVAMGSGPFAADALKIDTARIKSSKLMIEGSTKAKNETVDLDGLYKTTSDSDKLFSFAVPYHPHDCIVKIKAGNKKRRAVIRGCGAQGERGDRGKRGHEGPQGPQGIQGIAGARGPKGNQGIQGEQGPDGPEGPEGPEGPKGEAGVGAGKWWYSEVNVSDAEGAALTSEDGSPLEFMKGFIACSPLLTSDTSRLVSYWSINYGSTTDVEEISPSNTVSEFRPILYFEDGLIKVRIDSISGRAIRCRIEQLD